MKRSGFSRETSQSQRILFAVDINVLIDLVEKEEDLTDAVNADQR